MKKLLTLAAIGETATGLALLIVPSLVVWLLFDAEIVGVGVVMSRVAGIALIGLGVACWPGTDTRQASYGMMTYRVLAMLYLTYIGVCGEWVRAAVMAGSWVARGADVPSRAGLVQGVQGTEYTIRCDWLRQSQNAHCRLSTKQHGLLRRFGPAVIHTLTYARGEA